MDVLSTEIKTGAKEEYVQTTCLLKLPYFHGEISVVDPDLDSKAPKSWIHVDPDPQYC